MYKLVFNNDYSSGIFIEGYGEKYFPEINQRQFNANGKKSQETILSLNEYFQNILNKNIITSIKVYSSDAESLVIWEGNNYNIETSQINFAQDISDSNLVNFYIDIISVDI